MDLVSLGYQEEKEQEEREEEETALTFEAGLPPWGV